MEAQQYLSELNQSKAKCLKMKVLLEDAKTKESFSELYKELWEQVFWDLRRHDEFVRQNGYIAPIEKTFFELSQIHNSVLQFYKLYLDFLESTF